MENKLIFYFSNAKEIEITSPQNVAPVTPITVTAEIVPNSDRSTGIFSERG